MLKLTTTYTFNELMENAYRGAEDVLRVIAEHHKTEEFMQLVRQLGFEPLTPEDLWEKSQRLTKDEFIERVNLHNSTSGFTALNDDLVENSIDWYMSLGIPVDEDGEPLPCKE